MTDQFTPIINHYVALIKLKSLDESSVFIENIAQEIINDLDLKVVKKLSYMFSPKGTTLVYILSESHLVIHTWPELSTAHIDLVTCSHRAMHEFESSVRLAFSEENIDSINVKSVDLTSRETY